MSDRIAAVEAYQNGIALDDAVLVRLDCCDPVAHTALFELAERGPVQSSAGRGIGTRSPGR